MKSEESDQIKLSVEGFVKAYKVIESCEMEEHLDMARSYVKILEGIMHPTILPICSVLQTMMAIRLNEIRDGDNPC